MKKILVLALASALVGGAALAVWNAQDFVPAATLLVPYAVVSSTANNTVDPTGYTTLFAITNVSGEAQLVHMCVWSPRSNAVVDWDVYLTGFDVWTINFADMLNGDFQLFDTSKNQWTNAAGTARIAAPPGYTFGISGALIEGWGPNANPNVSFTLPVFNFGGSPYGVGLVSPGSVAACVFPYNNLPGVGTMIRSRLRADMDPIPYQLWPCSSFAYDDNETWSGFLSATTPFFFYVTADVVDQCTKQFQSSADYWTNPGGTGAIPAPHNVIVGDIIYLNPTSRYSEMINAVHLESGGAATTGLTNFYDLDLQDTAASPTVNTLDDREPLGTQYAFRYATSPSPYQSEILVWKNAHDIIYDSDAGVEFVLACQPYVYWAWNEDELTKQHGGTVSGQNFLEPNALPFETQAVPVNTNNFYGLVQIATPGSSFKGGAGFGWMWIDFNETTPYTDDWSQAEAYVVNRFIFGNYSAAAEAQLLYTPYNRSAFGGYGASLTTNPFPVQYTP